MTLCLDPPIRIGAHHITALCQYDRRGTGFAGGLWFSAGKHPVAILIRNGPDLRLLDPDGSDLTLADLEARYPGAHAVVMADTGQDHA